MSNDVLEIVRWKVHERNSSLMGGFCQQIKLLHLRAIKFHSLLLVS
jgi:hypothetical protein